MSKVNQPEARIALKCLFNHYFFSSYFSARKPANPPGGCDELFNNFNKCKDSNSTNV